MKILNQIVDTLKLHYYDNSSIDFNKEKFNSMIDNLIELKSVAQNIQSENDELRYVKHELNSHEFHLMARSVKGFSVVLKNRDVTIALRKIKKNTTPFLKVEFRSEFLVRVGYVEAIRIVNNLVKEEFHYNPVIKVSEIHLATDIQGLSFSLFDMYRFKMKARKKQVFETDDKSKNHSSMYMQGKKISGFVFGSGNYMLRVYNKTIEINKNKNKEYIKFYKWLKNPDYKEDLEVWRIEIQYRREKLKTLVDEKNFLLDGFENVLNSIPSLWVKAMNDYTLLNFSNDEILMLDSGFRKLKNGTLKPLTNYAVQKLYQRAEVKKEWLALRTWSSYNSNNISTYKMPSYGSPYYLLNSVKGLFSQMFKVYGDVSPDIFHQAFKDSEKLQAKYSDETLLDNVLNKQLDGFLKYKEQELILGVPFDSSNTLFRNIEKYAKEVSSLIFYEHNPKELQKIVKKIDDIKDKYAV